MKKILLILFIFTITSWTYEKPKDKYNNGNHYGHTQTLPIGEGTIFMLSMAVLYISNKITLKTKENGNT